MVVLGRVRSLISEATLYRTARHSTTSPFAIICVSGVSDSGFRVQSSGFRVQGSGFRVQGLGFRVQGSGFRVQGSGFRVYGVGLLI